MRDLRLAAASRRFRAALRARLAAWPAAIDGVAAVEFAMVLPVMITMLLGMTEVTFGVNMDRKLTLLSRSLADLSSRSEQMTQTEMGNIFAASSTVMQPYASSQVAMTVSSVKVTKVGQNFNGSIEWSCNRGPNATVRNVNSAYTVPSGFQQDASYFMLIEAKMPYAPLFGRAITGTITLAETTPWPVRNVNKVIAPSSCPT